MQITPVVKQLLILNIIMFVGCLFIPNANEWFALYYFENPNFKIWQVVSHMFMHGNFLHIAFNMFGLYSFGSTLEHYWGGKRFLFFYFSCGLGAALIHSLANFFAFHNGLDVLVANGYSKTEIVSLLAEGQYDKRWEMLLPGAEFANFVDAFFVPAVGASGAIYGLFAAFAIMFPNAELFVMFVPVPIKAKFVVPAMLLLDVFGGFSNYSLMGSNIAHFAHLGGALFGIIIMLTWRRAQSNQNRWN